MAIPATNTPQQSPLKLDPETGRLISQGAHFIGVTEQDFVAKAVRAYLEQRREEIRAEMIETMHSLDGSLRSSVGLLTGFSSERLDELGGVGEWAD